MITIKGTSTYCFNLDKSVGAGGKNLFGDVMLIQGFLRYIEAFDHGKVDGESVPAAPDLTGLLDHKTLEAIRVYQQFWSFRLLKADGIIHPGSYNNRNIKEVFHPLMTITYLHIHAKNAARHYGDPNYLTGMMSLMPRLRTSIHMSALAGIRFIPKRLPHV